MKPAWLGLLLCGAGLLCNACVSRASKATYPEAWSPATPVPQAQCPRLEGRYTNTGELAPGTNQAGCTRSKYGPYRGEWCGETALSQNIGNLASGDWVELRQPDKNTLVVVSSEPTIGIKELHYNRGDFTCSGNALERSLHASVASHGDNSDKTAAALGGLNATSTAFNAAMASGGVRTLTRRFSMTADGSLLMAVSQSVAGLVLLIPYREHYETFVRWAPAAPPLGGAAPTPSVAAAGAPPADLPSAHVGIFEATNGSIWSKLKVTNLDGTPVNTDAGYKGVPIAMEPGRHWVQVGLLSPHWIPPRDVNTKYAFELEAVAGHRYRIPDKPPSCLPPGDIDAALASSTVYHARLSVIDEVPGASGQSLDVQALCVSGRSLVCVPTEVATDAPVGSPNCVRLEGWTRGYYGRDAGALPAR